MIVRDLYAGRKNMREHCETETLRLQSAALLVEPSESTEVGFLPVVGLFTPELEDIKYDGRLQLPKLGGPGSHPVLDRTVPAREATKTVRA